MYKLKPCVVCNKDHNNPKYCSRECSRIYRYGYAFAERRCKCGKLLGEGWSGPKLCQNCRKNYTDWSKITLKQYREAHGTAQLHSRIRNLARAIAKKYGFITKCFNCDYTKHVEICHKKAVSSFEDYITIAEVNDIENLICLCPNCHWEFDNGLLVLI